MQKWLGVWLNIYRHNSPLCHTIVQSPTLGSFYQNAGLGQSGSLEVLVLSIRVLFSLGFSPINGIVDDDFWKKLQKIELKISINYKVSYLEPYFLLPQITSVGRASDYWQEGYDF